MFIHRDSRHAAIALALMAGLGVVLVFMFPGSPEQDTEYHFLMARTAWVNPSYFVGVWGRPLYTTVFAVPALMGFVVARLFAVGIGVGVAWQTWCLVRDLEMERTWLAVPLLLAQPVFFELFPDMLTEPLFALVFVVAVRWHLRGWTMRGMLAASLLPLARPEGVFLCLLWGVCVVAGSLNGVGQLRWSSLREIVWMIPRILILATGVFLWWAASFCITGDPLYILHNWPATWHQGVYGQGNIFSYSMRSLEFTGVLLLVPFLVGLWRAFPRRRWIPVTGAFGLLFVLHSIFRAYGLFGEAGYPRYMVSVSPAIAVLTLEGWNMMASWLGKWPRMARVAIGAGVLAVALAQSFLYLDSFTGARDGLAICEMSDWQRAHPQPYKRLIWSNARMCIAAGQDLEKSPSIPSGSRKNTLAIFREAPSGTLVFWDDHIGPEWFGLNAEDIARAGYQSLRVQHYSLPGVTPWDMYGARTGNREVELSLLYKQ
ncbi:MAG: hypothetical protein WCD79_18925 [Chthoniobacteraceae bacterium]